MPYEILSQIEHGLPQDAIRPDHSESAHFYRDCRTARFEDAPRVPSVTTKISIIDKPYLKGWAARRALEVVKERLRNNEPLDEECFRTAERAHEDVLRTAGDTGTNIHADIENYVLDWIAHKERPADIRTYITEGRQPSEHSGILAAEKFCRAFDLEPVAAELRVISAKQNFAGTFDALFIHREVYKGREGQKECTHRFEPGKKRIDWCLLCGREVKSKIVLADWKSSNSIKKDDYAWQSAAYAAALKDEAGVSVDECWVVRLSKDKPQFEVMKISNIKQAYKEFIYISKAYDAMQSREAGLLEPLVEPLVIKL